VVEADTGKERKAFKGTDKFKSELILGWDGTACVIGEGADGKNALMAITTGAGGSMASAWPMYGQGPGQNWQARKAPKAD
jgi:hypothetical protein